MDSPRLIQDLAIVLVAAGLCAGLLGKLRQPLVLGYIVAGVLIGPHLLEPGLVSEPRNIETLGELGVIFLLFSLGLDFNFTKLRKTGFGALLVGCVEMPLMLIAGYYLGGLLGWSTINSIFLGAVVSISSTTIIVRILKEMGKAHQPFARLIYAVLVAEDILAVLILAALSAIATTGTADPAHLAVTGLGVVIFMVLTAIAGTLIVPRIVRGLARHGAGEMLVIALMGVLFFIALLALKLGYSVALGAFIAGAIVGETREVRAVERIVAPLRDVFGAVFFVSVGLHIDPAVFLGLWQEILLVAALVIAGKILACSFGAFVVGYEPRVALGAGIGLAQIGEFSFIIAQLGMALGVVSERLYSITVGVSTLTVLISPHLIRGSEGIIDRFKSRAPAPLVTYISLYGSWLSRLKLPGAAGQVLKLIRKPLIQTFVNLLVAGAILAASRALLEAGFTAPGGLPTRTVAWVGGSLAAMPFLIAAWRKVRAIGLILAEAALMGRSIPEERALALRNLLANTVALLAAVLFAVWVLAAGARSLPPLPVMLAAAAFITVLTFVLYRWMVRFQASLQAGVQRLASRLPMDTEGTDVLPLELLKRYYPYGSGALEVEIPQGSMAAGQSLRDLDLRTRTGATVLAISRNGQPMRDFLDAPLEPGDTLLVTGEEAQIAEAKGRLTRKVGGSI